MKKIKVGVIGVGRGASMIQYCNDADHAELVAICDKWEQGLERTKKKFPNENIAYYTSYEAFLEHDMDVVVLANYAHEHGTFAIQAMKKGLDVISEVLPCMNLKQAVELIETVEQTGRKYCYLENYCYMPAPYEMKKLYQQGKIGELTYAEGEYIHNCESIWHEITYGERDHWRNSMYSTFYCTHSFGPIVHITGLRPVSVVGFEPPYDALQYRIGSKSALYGIEMVTLSNGAIVKSIHGGLYKGSIWYSLYGRKGRMESAREDAELKDVEHLYVNADSFEGNYDEKDTLKSYKPTREFDDKAQNYGHGRSDYYSMWNCIEYLRGNPDADIIDVYEAMDMFLPGLCAYFSILEGGKTVEVPDLRDKAQRDKYRYDTRCTYAEVAGDMLLPNCRGGAPEIPDSIFDGIRQKWEKTLKEDKNK